jgi:phospholipase C
MEHTPADDRLPQPHEIGADSVINDHQGDHSKIIRDHRKSGIKHIFVLMLENRSFDHMLGFSGIRGTDAATGKPTMIDGLHGDESNSFMGKAYTVSKGAPDVMPKGPGHNFNDVLEQLCGEGATYPSGSTYPPVANSGFVSSYAKTDPINPGAAMKCFGPDQVPVLTALAREFVVCDRWFSSMPGPTEPNRMFVHASQSGKFDDSPTEAEILEAILKPGGGFEFDTGTIFDRIKKAGLKFRIYADDHFPNVAELDGISVVWDIDEFEDFAGDVNSSSYDAAYTFIEPAYDALESFEGGNSQHPRGRVSAGERLIKATYEAIRKSPIWNQSLLVILWDEHGGFYDHVRPGPALTTGLVGRKHGFNFQRLGPRVPAVVVSPLIRKNLIEHRPLDHCAIPATLELVFQLEPLNGRTMMTSGLNHLARLKVPRSDTPLTLPNVAGVATPRIALSNAVARAPEARLSDDPHGNIRSLIHSAVVQHLQVSPPGERNAIIARAQALQTHADALNYLKEVATVVRSARVKAGRVRAGSNLNPI